MTFYRSRTLYRLPAYHQIVDRRWLFSPDALSFLYHLAGCLFWRGVRKASLDDARYWLRFFGYFDTLDGWIISATILIYIKIFYLSITDHHLIILYKLLSRILPQPPRQMPMKARLPARVYTPAAEGPCCWAPCRTTKWSRTQSAMQTTFICRAARLSISHFTFLRWKSPLYQACHATAREYEAYIENRFRKTCYNKEVAISYNFM